MVTLIYYRSYLYCDQKIRDDAKISLIIRHIIANISCLIFPMIQKPEEDTFKSSYLHVFWGFFFKFQTEIQRYVSRFPQHDFLMATRFILFLWRCQKEESSQGLPVEWMQHSPATSASDHLNLCRFSLIFFSMITEITGKIFFCIWQWRMISLCFTLLWNIERGDIWNNDFGHDILH